VLHCVCEVVRPRWRADRRARSGVFPPTISTDRLDAPMDAEPTDSQSTTPQSTTPQAVRKNGVPWWVILLPILVVVLGVVCSVVAVVAMGILDYAAVQTGANTSFTEVTLNGLRDNVRMYQIRVGEDPGDLQMLVDGPTDAAAKAKWVEPILDEVPKDAWGNDFLYKVSGNGFEIRSAGLDGQHGTSDDLVVEHKQRQFE
jgi:general secretion pathway protein G